MDLTRAYEDLLVATVGATATVLLALISRSVTAVTVGTVESIAPLGVYAAYRLSRKGGSYGSLDTARNWAILAGVVGGIVLVLEAV